MLESLKKEKFLLGMITNGKGKFQLDNVKALGIENYFDTMLISDLVGIKKPDPRIFEKALDTLGIKACESVFIGDHPVKDIHAAKQIGMKTIWKKAPHWETADADYIIDDLVELTFLLKDLNAPQSSADM